MNIGTVYTEKKFRQIFEIPELPKNRRIFLLTDENVFRFWGHLFSAFESIIVPAGESSKSLRAVENLINELINRGADRSTFLLAVGGGVLCDITGFTASVFMRGIPFAFVPSTLLAQTDAAIGGKNGVNTEKFKNMIGVFNFPEFILSDIEFLQTLTDSDFRDGLAENVKHACIKDAQFFSFLESNVEKILAREKPALQKLIANSVQIKCNIVTADPHEKGERKLLNFGHTFGHAVEKKIGISHGQAVSIGIQIINERAVKCGFLAENEAERVKNLLLSFGLPVQYEENLTTLLPFVKHDKKKSGNKISFIFLKKIGEAFIYDADFSEFV
jgi:3-dehydroquinate synthase